MSLVFDIGSNYGQFAKSCLVMFGFDSKIICVEPNPHIVNETRNVLGPNIHILNYAVASRDNLDLDFYINTKASGVSTVSHEWMEKSRFAPGGGWIAPIKVKTITLDTLIAQYGLPDFIKIDVEGFEFDVLQGLSQKAGIISFEWTEEVFDNTENCVLKLKNLGYTEFTYIIEDKYTELPTNYTSWEDCEIHKIIDKNRKEKFGMVFAR